MQSLVASRSSLRHLFTSSKRLLHTSRAFASSTASAAGAGDTKIHSEEPQGDDAEEAVKANLALEKQKEDEETVKTQPPPPRVSVTDEIPPFARNQRLESHEVVPPADPSFQQRRRYASQDTVDKSVLTHVSCLGPDGSPLGRDQDTEKVEWDREEDSIVLEDEKEYYMKHKASPLSEIEFADTRKPITRATDGGASDDVGWDKESGVIVEDTVDAALARAEAIFRQRAMEGIPEMPHSRALARMLCEQERRAREASL